MRPESCRSFLCRTLALGLLLAPAALPLKAQTAPVINLISGINAGTVVAGTSAGTVTLNSSGNRTVTLGTSLEQTAPVAVGSFTVTGTHKHGYSLANTTGPFSLTKSGATSLSANPVILSSSSGTFPGNSGTGTTPTITLGVTISLGPNPTAGTYTGSFTLTATDTTNTYNKTDTQVFNVTVVVEQAIGITSSVGLDFGDVFRGTVAGTVQLTAAGVRSFTGGTNGPTSCSLHVGTAAAFTVTGAASAGYSIGLPSSISLTGPGTAMIVDTFTSSPGPTGTLSSLGSQALTVGATLRVNANQADGDYNGTFTVTVTYN